MTNPVIPAEAVEAAAKAAFARTHPHGNFRLAIRELQDRYLSEARAALEAAAPYIRETVTEWAAAFRLTGEPYNFHRTREEAQAFVDDMSKQDVDMVVMTREVLPAQASEWAPYMLNNEGEK